MEGDAFLPSEIARLVLGYLKETGCRTTYQTFLKECVHLVEYNRLLQDGSVYPTSIGGKTLMDMLQQYGQKVTESQKAQQSQNYLWKKLECTFRQLKRCQSHQKSSPFKTGKTSGKYPSASLRNASTPRCQHEVTDSDFDIGIPDVSEEEVEDSSPSRCSMVSEAIVSRSVTIPRVLPKQCSYSGGCSDSGISGSLRSANSLQCSSPSLGSTDTSLCLEAGPSTSGMMDRSRTIVPVSAMPSYNPTPTQVKSKRGRPPKPTLLHTMSKQRTHVSTPLKLHMPGIVDKDTITVLKIPGRGMELPQILQTLKDKNPSSHLANCMQMMSFPQTSQMLQNSTAAKGVDKSTIVTDVNAIASTAAPRNDSKISDSIKPHSDTYQSSTTATEAQSDAGDIQELVAQLPDLDSIEDPMDTDTRTPFSQPVSDSPSTMRGCEKQSFLVSGATDDTSSCAGSHKVQAEEKVGHSPPSASGVNNDKLRTPVKNFLSQEFKDPTKNLSPRRKSQAPRRRSAGQDLSSQPRLRTSPAGCTSEHSHSNSNDSFISQGSQGFVPLIEELINNKQFATKLADNINKVTFKIDGEDRNKDSATEIPSCSTEVDASTDSDQLTPTDGNNRKRKDSLDKISTEELEHFLEEGTLNNIIEMTRNDPHFDTLFQMFNVDKNSFIEKEYGVCASQNQDPQGPLSFNNIFQAEVEVYKSEASSSVPTSMSVIPVAVEAVTSVGTSQSSNPPPFTCSITTLGTAVSDCLDMTASNGTESMSANTESQYVQIMYPSEDGQTNRIETVQVVSTPKPVDLEVSMQPAQVANLESAEGISISAKAMEQLDDLLKKAPRSNAPKAYSEASYDSVETNDSSWERSSTKSTPSRVQPLRRVTRKSSTPSTARVQNLTTKSKRRLLSSTTSVDQSPNVSDTTDGVVDSDVASEIILEEDEEEEERKITNKSKKVGLNTIGKTRKIRKEEPWKIPKSDRRKYLGISRSERADGVPCCSDISQSASLLVTTACDPAPSQQNELQADTLKSTVPANDPEKETVERKLSKSAVKPKKSVKDLKANKKSTKSVSANNNNLVQHNKTAEIIPDFASTIDVSCLPLCSVNQTPVSTKTLLNATDKTQDKIAKEFLLTSPRINLKKTSSIPTSKLAKTPSSSSHVRSLDFENSTANQKVRHKKALNKLVKGKGQKTKEKKRDGSRNISNGTENDITGSVKADSKTLPPKRDVTSMSVPDQVNCSVKSTKQQQKLCSSTAGESTPTGDGQEMSQESATGSQVIHPESSTKTPTCSFDRDSDLEVTEASKLDDTEVAETLISLSTKAVVTPMKLLQENQDNNTQDTIGFESQKSFEISQQESAGQVEGWDEFSKGSDSKTVEGNETNCSFTARTSQRTGRSVVATTSKIIGSPAGTCAMVRVASKPAMMAARSQKSNSLGASDDSSSSHSADSGLSVKSSSSKDAICFKNNDALQSTSSDSAQREEPLRISSSSPTKQLPRSNAASVCSPKRTSSLKKLVQQSTMSLRGSHTCSEPEDQTKTGAIVKKTKSSSNSSPPDGRKQQPIAVRLTPVKQGTSVTLAVNVTRSPNRIEKHTSQVSSHPPQQPAFKLPQKPIQHATVAQHAKSGASSQVDQGSAKLQQSRPSSSGKHTLKNKSVPNVKDETNSVEQVGKDDQQNTGNANKMTKSVNKSTKGVTQVDGHVTKPVKRKRDDAKTPADKSPSQGPSTAKKVKKNKDVASLSSMVNLGGIDIDKLLSKMHKK